MHPAAKAVRKHYAAQLTEEAGFWRGILAATVFWEPKLDRGARGRLHGVGSRAILAKN